MKQRLMALTIDFEKAFKTIVLITVNGGIMGHNDAATFIVCERYMLIIQVLNDKSQLNLVNKDDLAREIGAMEMYFNFYPNDEYYLPWAENVSSSIEGDIEDYSHGPHGLHCDCNECIPVVSYPIDETASFNEQNLVTIAPSIEEKMDRVLAAKNYSPVTKSIQDDYENLYSTGH